MHRVMLADAPVRRGEAHAGHRGPWGRSMPRGCGVRRVCGGAALKGTWEAAPALIAEVALRPTFPLEEVELERRLILSAIQSRCDTPFQRAFDAMLADLYGRHGYGLPNVGTREGLARLDRAALETRYGSLYRPDRMVLAVSGQVPRDKVIRAAERLFRGMPPATTAGPPAPTPQPPRGARDVVERPAQQAQVMVGYITPGLTDPDYPAVRVLGMLLGAACRGVVHRAPRPPWTRVSGRRAGTYRTGPSFLLTYMARRRPMSRRPKRASWPRSSGSDGASDRASWRAPRPTCSAISRWTDAPRPATPGTWRSSR
jgi:hypothetical protein